MRAYVYWPFLREEEYPLLEALAGLVQELVVHTVRRSGTPARGDGALTLIDDLPDVTTAGLGSLSWLANRTWVYRERSRRRHATVARVRPDVVHVVYQNVFTDVVALRRLHRLAPVVSTVHDVWPHNRRFPRGLYRPLLSGLYRASGEIVVLNDVARRCLLDDFTVVPARVHVLPHQVPRFRREPRTLSPEPSVLFFGTFRRNKGLDTLLEAAPAITAAGIRVVVAGRGDPALEEAARASSRTVGGLDVEVGWVSPQRKAELFAHADLVVLPYHRFSSESGVLNDAYGHHLPVVVTDVAGLRENVEMHGTGWVVPAEDPVRLSHAVIDALRNPDAWNARMRASRARAEANPPEVVATQLRAVYDAAISAGRRRTLR